MPNTTPIDAEAAPSRAPEDISSEKKAATEANGDPRPAASSCAYADTEKLNQTKDKPNAQPRPLPPREQLVTVDEAAQIFQDAGLPRHMRTIQKYCKKRKGQVLACHEWPTETGWCWMIEKKSIDRFIQDATEQEPIGDVVELNAPPRPGAALVENPPETGEGNDITKHWYVKELKSRVDSLEKKNDQLHGVYRNQLNTLVTTALNAAQVGSSERLAEIFKEHGFLPSANADHRNEQTEPDTPTP